MHPRTPSSSAPSFPPLRNSAPATSSRQAPQAGQRNVDKAFQKLKLIDQILEKDPTASQIPRLKILKGFVMEGLALLPSPTTPWEKTVQSNLHQYLAQLGAMLGAALIDQFERTPETEIDERLSLSQSLKDESSSVVENLRGVPDVSDRRLKISDLLEQQKQFLSQSIQNLYAGYIKKAQATPSQDDSINYYRLALTANQEISPLLQELPNTQDAKNTCKWHEWGIRKDLERQCSLALINASHSFWTTWSLTSAFSGTAETKENFLLLVEKGKDLSAKADSALSELKGLQEFVNEVEKKKSSNKKADKSLWQAASKEEQQEFAHFLETNKRLEVMTSNLGTQGRMTVALEKLRYESLSSASSLDTHMENLLAAWLEDFSNKNFLAFSTLDSLFNPVSAVNTHGEQLSPFEKHQLLTDLLQKLTTMESDTLEAADFFQRQGLDQEKVKTFEEVKECVLRQQEIIRSALKDVRLTGDDAKRPPSQYLINTQFDGKVIGKRQGEYVIVTLPSQEKVKYRQKDDIWVRDTTGETTEGMLSDLDNTMKETTLSPTASPDFKKLDKVEEKVRNWLAEAKKREGTAEYTGKNGGLFSQVDGFHKLAIQKCEEATNVLAKTISRLQQYGADSEVLTARLQTLRSSLDTAESQIQEIEKQRLHDAKHLPPSGQALNFLLDKGEIERVTQTKTKEKLKGLKVSRLGISEADFMDEHLIYPKGLPRPFRPLHTHYRKVNASLEEKTASHFKYMEGGKEVRNGVSLEVLQKLHRWIAPSST